MEHVDRRGERGQVLVLAAMLMALMLGFLGVVVDVGNAYAQRRFMQNAADAAAVAAARHLAATVQSGTSDSAIVGIVDGMLSANGGAGFLANQAIGALDGAWYVGPTGARVAALGSGLAVPAVPVGGTPSIAGVEIVARRTVNTFFARIMGFNTVTVSASATARYGSASSVLLTPPGGARVMPIIFDLETYNRSVATCGGFSGTRVTFAIPITAPFSCSGATGAGGFSWGPIIPTNNANSIVDTLLDPNGSLGNLTVRIGDAIQVSDGNRTDDYRDLHSNWQGQDVIVPLVANTAALNCPNCSPPLHSYAWFHVYQANGHGSPKTVTGWWVDPRTKPPITGRPVGSTSILSGPITFTLTR